LQKAQRTSLSARVLLIPAAIASAAGSQNTVLRLQYRLCGCNIRAVA
jgi:hypothetical protein